MLTPRMYPGMYPALIVLSLIWVWADAYAGERRFPPSPEKAPAAPGGVAKPDKDAPTSKPATNGTVDQVCVTDGSVSVGGRVVRYRATAANMVMKDESGNLKATVFFVAYEKKRSADADPARRPLAFVFNGGPGAAAVWLHLGTAGPRRIALDEKGLPPAPPYSLVENAYSWLDTTDLVLIDPVGTGFSRPAEGQKPEQFYGVEEDIAWVADFIRLYITQYRRWLSPLFLAGESYGTTRAAGLSEHLLDRYGIALNGIVLISSVLDFQTIQPGEGNDLPYPLYLPTYAAVAWYHKRLAPDLQADLRRTLREVRRWAIETYLVALARGESLESEAREAVVRRLARYTSLPVDFIEKCNLRVSPGVFQKRLLEAEGKLIGRFDGRITGVDPQPTSSGPPYDPSLSLYLPVYSATFNDYVRRTLKFESTLPYDVLSERVRPWNFGPAGRGYLSVTGDLRSAMVKNPHLKVLFASGYFDLATPFFAADYTIDHLGLDDELRANITHRYYMGGHMMYHNRPALEKLHADVTAFIRKAADGEHR